MLIRRVTAHAFGPLSGESLEFADGMTVVYGPNESAKSSWHAALYSAICGRRRGRGVGAADRRFAELHRPWGGGDWAVSAEVRLDDGRRVELRQDLETGVDCHAVDLVLGRDLSSEIMNDGTPDAARWLGLDRHSFAATACVFQAQVLAVQQLAGGLQEYLQRAAATAGVDATAAAAIERIDEFRRERVGGDHAPTRPLRRALADQANARAELAAATRDHADLERRLAQASELRARADAAERTVRQYEAAMLVAAARAAELRADEAAERHRRSAVGVTVPLAVDRAGSQTLAPPPDHPHGDQPQPRSRWLAVAALVLVAAGVTLAAVRGSFGVVEAGLVAGGLGLAVAVVLARRGYDGRRERRAVVQAQADYLSAWREATHRANVLGEQTVAELLRQAELARARADRAAAPFPPDEVAAIGTVSDGLLDQRRVQATAATRAAVLAEGSATERAAALPSVSEAEEAAGRAEHEVARLRDLDETLLLTRRFLLAAQERAHRDIAPVLAGTVRQGLAMVTSGRYDDVIVDPQNLQVRVCGSARTWRLADRVSRGTAEQIYLLLRIALAGHLATQAERCPLILDEVTVHADSQRTAALLDLLLRTAQERQVVIFTQQELVRDWAQSHLPGPHHGLRELAPVATS